MSHARMAGGLTQPRTLEPRMLTPHMLGEIPPPLSQCPKPMRQQKNRTPEWVCGRCTMRLPGPPPAFDTSATCGFPIGMDYRYPQMTMDRDVERCASVPLDGNARVSS